MNHRQLRFCLSVCLGLACMAGGLASDAPALAVDLSPAAHEALWSVTNGSVETRTEGDVTVYRWHVNNGQTSRLSLKEGHPLLYQLRYYDQMRMEFRLLSGAVHELGLNAIRHVSGPRQNKEHQWTLGILTTPANVWHARLLNLARPNWFPWDNTDGYGTEPFFRLEAIALMPNTVIELRHLALTRAQLQLKPDFELPVTWPIATRHDDGSVTYALTHHLRNISGTPLTMRAAITSAHKAFRVGLFAGKAKVAPVAADAPREITVDLKNAQHAMVTVLATITAEEIKKTKELFAEPLRMSFGDVSHPAADTLWQGELVRPLSDTLNRQVLVAQADLETIRKGLAAEDKKLAHALQLQQVLKTADEFLTKELLAIPTGHTRVRNGWYGDWRPGKRMPEIVDAKTGETKFGPPHAAPTWKEYLGHSGQVCERLAMSYLFTGEEKYAQKAVELFELYGKQYTSLAWGNLNEAAWMQGEAVLCASRPSTASTYGTNWYFKGHCRLLSAISGAKAWTPEVEAAVYTGFALPYAHELMKFPGGISNMTDITNHNVLLLGLVFRDAGLVRWSLMSDPGLVSRLRDITEGGFSSEGRPVSYHQAAMAEYLPTLTYLAKSGLLIEYSKEKVLAAIRMPYVRASLTGRIPSTGDCARGQGVRNTALADYLLELFPKETWLYDIGSNATVSKKLQILNGKAIDRDAWKTQLSTAPHLFEDAGLAILRTGTTPETQIMATLDYGRNLFHAALDRNQVTLWAFGKVFSHGPGSLYNVGRGGMTRVNNPKLESFCGHHSLGQNVIVVDEQNQLPAVGKLLAWNAAPEMQVAVSEVEGIQPGVKHTRALVLAKGVVVMLDRVESAETHTYDFVYHNLGTLALGKGWSSTPLEAPLATTANYDNLLNPAKLAGSGPVHLEWDLTSLIPARQKTKEGDTPPPVKLALWQLVGEGQEAYTATTGMNNPDTMIIPSEAPSLITRSKSTGATFVTVLEPYTTAARVTAVAAHGADGVTITLTGETPLTLSLAELLSTYAVKGK